MEENILSLQDLLKEVIYPKIDLVEAFIELDPIRKSGKNIACKCPSCGQKRAYISISKKKIPQLICNRQDACGHYESIWKYIQNKGTLSNYETLKELAKLAHYNLDDNKYEVEFTREVKHYNSNETDEINYMHFDKEKDYSAISISKFLPKFGTMKPHQKLKMLYTYIYQYSKYTNQKPKLKYYESRNINLKNKYVNEIGFLSSDDVKKLTTELQTIFPLQDLLEYGILKVKTKDEREVLDRNGNRIYVFKQYCYKGFCVVPSYDMYSNMITGLKLRNVELAEWQPKSMKEPEMSNRDIVYPLPFAFNREMLLDTNACIFIVEGHVDGLSLPVTSSKIGQSEIDYEKSNTYFIASPGTNGISQEVLGLLKGKFIVLCFDQDEAGRKGAYGSITIKYGDEKEVFVNDFEGKQSAKRLMESLEQNSITYYANTLKGMKEKLEDAGARVYVKHWDISLGKDVNELLQNSNLNRVFNF